MSSGIYTAINTPGGLGGTQALGINNLGEIVGVHNSGSGTASGFLLFDGVFMVPVDVPLPGGLGAVIYGINTSGVMVATNGGTNAFLIVPTPPGGEEKQQ